MEGCDEMLASEKATLLTFEGCAQNLTASVVEQGKLLEVAFEHHFARLQFGGIGDIESQERLIMTIGREEAGCDHLAAVGYQYLAHCAMGQFAPPKALHFSIIKHSGGLVANVAFLGENHSMVIVGRRRDSPKEETLLILAKIHFGQQAVGDHTERGNIQHNVPH